MRCVSYTRTVSCLREKEIPSDIINQQNKRIQEFIKQKGWSLVILTVKRMSLKMVHFWRCGRMQLEGNLIVW